MRLWLRTRADRGGRAREARRVARHLRRLARAAVVGAESASALVPWRAAGPDAYSGVAGLYRDRRVPQAARLRHSSSRLDTPVILGH